MILEFTDQTICNNAPRLPAVRSTTSTSTISKANITDLAVMSRKSLGLAINTMPALPVRCKAVNNMEKDGAIIKTTGFRFNKLKAIICYKENLSYYHSSNKNLYFIALLIIFEIYGYH